MTEIHRSLHDDAVVPGLDCVAGLRTPKVAGFMSNVCSGFVIFGEAAFYLMVAVEAIILPNDHSARYCLSQDHTSSGTCYFCVFLSTIQALMLMCERKLLVIRRYLHMYLESVVSSGRLAGRLTDRHSAGQVFDTAAEKRLSG